MPSSFLCNPPKSNKLGKNFILVFSVLDHTKKFFMKIQLHLCLTINGHSHRVNCDYPDIQTCQEDAGFHSKFNKIVSVLLPCLVYPIMQRKLNHIKAILSMVETRGSRIRDLNTHTVQPLSMIMKIIGDYVIIFNH